MGLFVMHQIEFPQYGGRARAEHENPIGQEQCFVDVVRDQQDGRARLADQVAQCILQRHPRQRIERTERFVEQQNLSGCEMKARASAAR